MRDMTKRSTFIKNKRSHRFLSRFHIESRILLLLGAFVFIAAFFSITEERFLTPRSISSMAFQCPEIGLMALSMAITMIIGGINLSINDTANLSALMAGLFLVKLASPTATADYMSFFIIGIAILIALVTGLLCGVLNGVLVGYIGVPPILATLATLTLYRGISVVVTGGKTLTGFPKQLSVIGHQTVVGIPISFIILVAMGVLMYVIFKYTTFGFKARMLGTNPTAAKFSGINSKSITMKIYILSGILGAIAGIIVMSRINSVAYEYGTRTYILLTLLISVLGGISPGFGNVIGVLFATFILQILSTGFHMLLLGVRGSSFFKDFSWGVLLIVFLIIDYFMHHRERMV